MVVPPVLAAAAPDVGAVPEGAVLRVAVRVGGVHTLAMRGLKACVFGPRLADAVPVRHVPENWCFGRARNGREREPAHGHGFSPLQWPVRHLFGLVVPDVG